MTQATDSSDTLVAYSVNDGIGHIVLNAPPYNMMEKRWSQQFRAIVTSLSPESLRGIVVSGAGRHFSAGAVLDDIARTAQESYETGNSADAFPLSRDSLTFHMLAELPIPVVAAMRGVCIGSGFELALACHYRVCDKNATMGLVESTFGLMPGCGGTLRLTHLVGRAKAVELALSGQRFGSEEALSLRIVHEVVHHSELVDRAVGIIRRVAPIYRARYGTGSLQRNDCPGAMQPRS